MPDLLRFILSLLSLQLANVIVMLRSVQQKRSRKRYIHVPRVFIISANELGRKTLSIELDSESV